MEHKCDNMPGNAKVIKFDLFDPYPPAGEGTLVISGETKEIRIMITYCPFCGHDLGKFEPFEPASSG